MYSTEMNSSTVLTFATPSCAFQLFQQPQQCHDMSAGSPQMANYCVGLLTDTALATKLCSLSSFWLLCAFTCLSPILFLCLSSVSLPAAFVRLSAGFFAVPPFCTVRCWCSDSLLKPQVASVHVPLTSQSSADWESSCRRTFTENEQGHVKSLGLPRMP